MAPALVFGYGSLLAGAAGTPCRLSGHRRGFGVAMDNRRTIPGYKYYLDPDGGRPPVHVAFLDVIPDGAGAVGGVVFEVPDLRALDARERNYARVEVSGLLDADLGAPVWAYAGLPEARRRYARAAAAGTAVVARAYLESVRAGFAAYGLALDTSPDVPVVDLVRIDVPANGNGAG
jgi:cation transport regulator ChaC